MFHFPVPHRGRVQHIDPPPFITGFDVFSAQEMDKINADAERLPGERASVGPDLKIRDEENRSIFRHLPPNESFLWVYQRMANAVSALNASAYQFDITGFDEPLYHITYDASIKGHYNWHYDGSVRGMAPRKLSITFQMSDATSYKGGVLELNRTGTPTDAPKERGTFILFPSYILHRVTPVTKGVRKALVGWVSGPPMR